MKLPVSAVAAVKRNVAYPKFQGEEHTFVLLEGRYFIYPEVIHSLERLGHKVIRVEVGQSVTGVMQGLLRALVEYKPDCILAVNHIGFDAEGQIGDLLDASLISCERCSATSRTSGPISATLSGWYWRILF